MNREEMVEQAAAALGAARCVVGCTVEQHTREGARAVLDAVLPQVTTVAELQALPPTALLLIDDSGRGSVHPAQASILCGGFDLRSDVSTYHQWLATRFPLTVVWTPEVTA